MNTEIKNEPVTTSEYFSILEKQDKLTPIEINKKRFYENFITTCSENIDLLSPTTENIYKEYQKEMHRICIKENRTYYEEEALQNYQAKMLQEDDKDYVRKLSKAGYVNATIIMVMILNIGFIVAMALLGNK